MADTAESRHTASKPKEAAPSPRRRSNLRLWLLGMLVLLAAAYFAPTLVAVTPLRQRILPGLFPKLAARSDVGSATLGWFVPAVLYDVRIVSEAGEPLLEAETVTTEFSLIGLISAQSDLGRYDIEKPTLHVALRHDGSNVEDAIAPMLAPNDEPVKPKAFTIRILDGNIQVDEVDTGEAWQLSGFNSSIDLPLETKKSISIESRVTAEASSPESALAFSIAWYPPDSPVANKAGTGEFEVDIERLPLAVSRGLLQRFVGDLQLAGEAGLRCKAKWDAAAGEFDLDIAELRGDQIDVLAPEMLAERSVHLESLRGAGGIDIHGDRLALDQITLEADPANVTLSGSLNLSDFQRDDLLAAVFAQQVTTTGKIDLARLAAMLPETLHVREGTRITSGQVAWDLTTQDNAGRRRLVGRLDTTGLAADNAGQLISWEQPIQMTLAVEQSDDGPVVEQLQCTSSFLQINGAGTARAASLKAECSLDELRNELGRFVDLGEFQLRGKLTSDVSWQRAEDGQLTTGGKIEIAELALELPGMRPWREPSLTADFHAAGRYRDTGALDLDQARASVVAGEDVFTAQLLEAVADAGAGNPVPVQVEFRGNLAAWLARGQMFLPLEDWQVAGRANLTATGSVSTQTVSLTKFDGQIDDLNLQGGGLFINEPLVKLAGQDVVMTRGEANSLSVVDATLATSAISIRAQNVRAASAEAGPTIAGNLVFRSDLGRLMNWIQDPQAPHPIHVFGEAVGKANVSLTQGVSSADVNIDVTEFTVAKPPTPENQQWQALWREPALKLVGKAAYDREQGAAQLDNLSVQSNALSVTASGKVADLAQRVQIDLDGQLAYDLEKISPVLRPYLGDDFSLTGKKNESFSVHGPALAAVATPGNSIGAATPGVVGSPVSAPFVISPELKAEVVLGWDSANVMALDVGQGSLDAKLRDGVVQITPIDLPVSGGRVQFAPRFLLNQQPMLMVADRGQVFEHVAITPAMCRTWLKYINPMVADATEVKGKLSTTLEGAVVPLSNPLDGNIKGALSIHSAEIGPGPLGRQILFLVRQIEYTIKRKPLEALTLPPVVWLNMPEQTIEFQMADRGVRHKNLYFVVGDVEVRTEGTVGFDQSLDLVALIPIRDEWTSQPWLSTMKGQTLRIPLHGTLQQPQIDDSAWRAITAKMIQGTTQKILQQGLKKLFEPK